MDLLDYVPQFLRSVWLLKKYYWQQDEIAEIHIEAERLMELFDGQAGSSLRKQ